MGQPHAVAVYIQLEIHVLVNPENSHWQNFTQRHTSRNKLKTNIENKVTHQKLTMIKCLENTETATQTVHL